MVERNNDGPLFSTAVLWIVSVRKRNPWQKKILFTPNNRVFYPQNNFNSFFIMIFLFKFINLFIYLFVYLLVFIYLLFIYFNNSKTGGLNFFVYLRVCMCRLCKSACASTCNDVFLSCLWVCLFVCLASTCYCHYIR